MKELGRALLRKAKAGDVAACKLLLSYLVGLPAAPAPPPPDPDLLDEHEHEVKMGKPGPSDRSMLALMKGL